jgi:hypothetical protein
VRVQCIYICSINHNLESIPSSGILVLFHQFIVLDNLNAEFCSRTLQTGLHYEFKFNIDVICDAQDVCHFYYLNK